jgi:SSS family solute:Na+ symporter
MAFIDWVIIAAYFAVVFGIALWAYQQEKEDDTPSGYFLGGRNVGWFVVGASLFVSNIGSEHLVGLSGTGADSGVAVGQFEILASLILLLLGWVFVPFYVKSGVFTMPEFLERRFSKGARTYLTWISIVGYVLTKISVTLFAGGIVFETLMGINFWTGALITVAFTGVYTIFGGLRAVVYTDLMQMFVLVAGSVLVTVMGLIQIGGPGALVATVPSGFMSVWKPISDPSFPWTGILFGAPILGVWYWCTDQVIVQRTLAARDIDHARRGSIFAGYLKALPLFIFVIPGVIAFGLSESGQLNLDNPDQALPALVASVLPVGLRGLVAAGLIAALMSSLSSVFNSTSTLITWDVYREWRPTASDRELVWVGRVATAGLTVLGLAWIPFIQNISSTLYTYLQSVQSYIAPPIAAVFILGLAWKRINAAGALTTLLVGFVLGATRLILELVHGPNQEGLPAGTVWAAVAEFNFLHLAVVLFVICVLILITVSMATSPPPDYKIAGLTYGTAEQDLIKPPPSAGDDARAARDREEGVVKTKAEEAEEREEPLELTERPEWRRRDVLLSVGVAIAVGLVWLFFSPIVF